MSTTDAGQSQARDSAFFSAGLAERDPEVSNAINNELKRQRDEIELIASENIVSKAVLEAAGSVFDQQIRRGLSTPALLWRLPACGCCRTIGD